MTCPEKFEGHANRECGEHRTLGHRAWCFNCSEYCYEAIPCMGCERPLLLAALRDAFNVDRDVPTMAAQSLRDRHPHVWELFS